MTVYLIRHASAGSANHSDPDDLQRPLDSAGRDQAQTIAELLGEAPLAQLYSSPALRCTQTLGPLSLATNHEIQQAPDLVEGTDIDESWQFLVDAATGSGTNDVALCSHGDVIPELIGRARMRGMTVPGPSGCSKGSIWALDWDGQHFVEGRYRSTHTVGSIASGS